MKILRDFNGIIKLNKNIKNQSTGIVIQTQTPAAITDK